MSCALWADKDNNQPINQRILVVATANQRTWRGFLCSAYVVKAIGSAVTSTTKKFHDTQALCNTILSLQLRSPCSCFSVDSRTEQTQAECNASWLLDRQAEAIAWAREVGAQGAHAHHLTTCLHQWCIWQSPEGFQGHGTTWWRHSL